jgi:adenosine deaminase CECR1
MDAHEFQRTPTKLVNNPCHQKSPAHVTNTVDSNVSDKDNRYDLADALDRVTQDRRGDKNATRVHTVLDRTNRDKRFLDDQDYERQRIEIMTREASLSWDFICKRDASPIEEQANRILQAMRKHDDENVYQQQPSRRGYRGQEHPRFMGDHFLYNVDLIENTKLFQVARKMPKGAHLHIHFNANLEPHVLIDIATGMERMFISSNIPLVVIGEEESDPRYYDNFDRSKIRFTVLSKDNEKLAGTGNVFDHNYPGHDRPMSFQRFRNEFGQHYTKCTVDEWLRDKLVFHEEEAHGWLQTAEGAWDRFNARTQMMKGLFNYKTAYRSYTQQCLQDFADDGIQYAEIRVNFMSTNQLWTDKGERLPKEDKDETDNEQILKIIIAECNKFVTDRKRKSIKPDFAGIKVIYCTPRSFEPKEVEPLLAECLKFKQKYPKWIAGELLQSSRASDSRIDRI